MHRRSLVSALLLIPLAVAPAADAVPRGYHYVGDYRVTYYWVAQEIVTSPRTARDQTLYDVDGCAIAQVSGEFRRRLDLEGTGRLADGRVVNVAHRTADGWRYVELGPAAWGLGAGGIPLLPFRSVAADPRHLPRGSRLHIPAFAGTALAGATLTGGFVVDDVGSAISARRIDVFIGEVSHLSTLEARVPSHAATAVYLWDEDQAPPPDLLRGD